MPCQFYPPADLDELEEAATEATPGQQKEALQIVADIFNRHQLPYGLMGGMNFYFRGSGRSTDDVDLAVTGAQSLQATLDLLNEDERWVPLGTLALMLGRYQLTRTLFHAKGHSTEKQDGLARWCRADLCPNRKSARPNRFKAPEE